MEKLKSVLIWIVVLALIGLVGFWAVTHLQSGSDFAANQKVKELQAENDDLNKQVADLKDQLATAQSEVQNSQPAPAANPAPAASTPAPTPAPASTTTTYKNQTLINSLQSLSDKGITMKLKEGDASVGYVQQFLNLYFKTSNKIDNDYGSATQKAVAAFQKDQGLKADGNAGPTTFDKMVAWLKKQG